MSSIRCPVCGCVESSQPRKDLTPHPYVECVSCRLYYQPNPPEKIYEAFHESPGNLMSKEDRLINEDLARRLYTGHLTKKCQADSFIHLDVGSKYPYLGHCLQKISEGRLTSYGVDGIEEVGDFGAELGVKMFRGDFESMDLDVGQIHLMTLIHCIEHLYRPLDTLRKIASMMAPDGIFFVRCPDSQVAGIERDFTQGHYDIHPLVWNEQAMYEALYQLKDCFRVEETYTLYGQRDYLLRPLQKKPLIGAGYIVKNEERDLPDSLESIRGCADLVCIRDTGSTDRTHETVLFRWPEINYETYTGASRQDSKGDWKLWDFSSARNEYVRWLDERVDWVLWMDADDTISPEAARIIRRAPYMPYDMHGFRIQTGHNSHLHHRLWRTKSGVWFHGACHEYPAWPSHFAVKEWVEHITHNGADGVGESSIMRNLRILQEETQKHPSHRNLFYLANTYRDAYGIPSNTEEEKKAYLNSAITIYDRYVNNPGTYWDELMFCYIYKARCYRWLNDYEACIRTVREGMSKDPSFAELPMEACYLTYNQGDKWRAASWALQAHELPFKHRLFAEKDKYEDQPLRMLAHCFNDLGYKNVALDWGQRVLEKVDDPSWREFLGGVSSVINLNRPGALGDVLMTGWLLEGLRKKYPGHKIHYYTKCREIAELLEVDQVLDSDKWAKRTPGIDFSLVGYPVKDGYPDVAMKKHIIEYLGEEVGVETCRPHLKCAYFMSDLQPKTYITVHVKTGWSDYKEWAQQSWMELIGRSKSFRGDKLVVQIGGPEDPLIPGCIDKRNIGLSAALGLIKGAWLHLGVDSFTNHAAGIFETPAVILFGSTSPIGSGYKHAENIWLGLPCSPCYKERVGVSKSPGGPCTNLVNNKHACMEGLSVNYVFNVISEYMDKKHENVPTL